MVTSNLRPTPPGRRIGLSGRCTLPPRGGCASASNSSNPQRGVSGSRGISFFYSIYNLILPPFGWTGWTCHIDPGKIGELESLPSKSYVQGGLDVAGVGLDASKAAAGG